MSAMPASVSSSLPDHVALIWNHLWRWAVEENMHHNHSLLLPLCCQKRGMEAKKTSQKKRKYFLFFLLVHCTLFIVRVFMSFLYRLHQLLFSDKFALTLYVLVVFFLFFLFFSWHSREDEREGKWEERNKLRVLNLGDSFKITRGCLVSISPIFLQKLSLSSSLPYCFISFTLLQFSSDIYSP